MITSESMAATDPDLSELDTTLDRLHDDLQRLTVRVETTLNQHSMSMSHRKHLEDVLNKPASKLVNVVAMLKTLQNHVCRANVLPHDIWGNIFYLAVVEVKVEPDDAPYDICRYRLRTNHSQLDSLVTVCRYWRDVCVQTPSLWSRVSWRTSRLQEEFIRRHPSMLLDISLDDDYVPGVLFDLSSPRCRVLQWSRLAMASISNRSGIVRIDGRLLDFSGEDLEDLRLVDKAYYAFGNEEEAEAWPMPETIIGPTLFGDSIPRLRSVSLCGLTWVPTNHFITVTRLLIGHCLWSHPISTILDLLSSTPQLVDFILSGMLNEQREEAHVDRARNVHLTNLRRFSLHEVDPASDSDGIASLLSKLVLPPQAVVLLNSTGDSEANGHWIPETLSRSDFDFARPTRMQLRFHRPQRSHRDAGQLRLSAIAASQHGGVIVTKEPLEPAGRFASNFHLSQLQYLLYLEAPSHIDDDGLWQSWMWSSILPEVPALERLTIFGRSLPDIARALNRDGPMRVQPHLCPQLSQIVVLLSSDDPPVDRTMATLVAIKERLHFSHVTIGYLPDHMCEEEEDWQLEGKDDLLDSVEYVKYEGVPGMKTPWPDQTDLPALPQA